MDSRLGTDKQEAITLGSLLDEVERLDGNSTIYAEANPDWTEFSAAVACYAPLDGGLPIEAVGKKYFLEVWIAKEVIEVWKQWRGGRSPSSSEKREAIIYYAKNDSYLPVESQA